jgi:ubiquinone biosynthesis accessory factor UbiK
MFDPKALDDIANRLAILQSALGKLDLVTREEFEVQKGVLAKTRSKLEALETQVSAIEKQLSDKSE